MKKIICVFLACLMLTGCGAKHFELTNFRMNTVISLKLWSGNAEQAARAADEMIRVLEQDFSTTGGAVVNWLNEGEGTPPDAVQQALLGEIDAISRRTGGAFNPHLRSLSQAWGFYHQQYRVPTQAEIEDALADPKWDLGAALKGYAGDRAVDVLKQHKVERAILNLGGNIQTYGQKPDGSPWQIGIQNPDGGAYVGIVSVSGTASVVTSGDYQRYFEQDGVRYHHIIDPKTGYPADSGLRAVTVICRDGLTADALSTALYVMGLEKATDFWRQSENFEAVFITKEGKVYATQDAGLSGCEFEVIKR